MLKHLQTVPALLVLGILGWIFSACDTSRPVASSRDAPAAAGGLAPEDLLAAARAGGEFLLGIQREDASFPEIYDAGEDAFLGDSGENHFLQARLCSSLARLAEVTGEGPYLESAERCLDLLLGRLGAPRAEHLGEDFAFLTDGSDFGRGDLGASALTLLALIEESGATGDLEHLPTMRRLAAFLLFQQDEVGTPTVHYPVAAITGAGEGVSDPPEPYAVTQAALALVRLSRLDKENEEAWRQGAERFVGFVMGIRDLGKTYDHLPQDPWLMQALTELYEVTEGGRTYFLHGRRTAAGILRRASEEESPPGALAAARRGEALAAMVRLAVAAGQDPDPYSELLESSARYLIGCQVSSSGGIGDEPGSSRIATRVVADGIYALLEARDRFSEEKASPGMGPEGC